MTSRPSAGAAGARSCTGWPRPSTSCPTAAAKCCGCDGSRNCPRGRWPCAWASARRRWKSTSPRACACSRTPSTAGAGMPARRKRIRTGVRPMGARESTEAPGGVDARAAEWLARRDRGGWSDADAAGLEAWLEEATAHRVAFLRVQAAWEQCGRLQALGAGLHDGPPGRGHWTRGAAAVPHGLHDGPALESLVFAPRHPRPGAARTGGRLAFAATAVVALGLALGWQWRSAVDASTHSTAMGGIESVPLADGSRTVLGSDSRIEVRLSRGERRIELQQGEAFFEAAKDPRRPFVVEAGERRVVAVGTRFSVRRDGPDLRVVVTEGSVRLESGPDGGRRRPMATLPAGSVALA